MDATGPLILVAVNDVFFYTKIRDALRQDFTLQRIRSLADVADDGHRPAPSLIIMNLNEPVFDAFEALAQIRTQPGLATVPILAFANHEEVETWKRAKDLGVTRIVSRNEFSARTRALAEELLPTSPPASSDVVRDAIGQRPSQ